MFNQAILHLLKQFNDTQRDQVISLIQGQNKGVHLVSKFGDKEYSLLSALASSNKLTKHNALTALLSGELIAKLSVSEKDLIKISLSQLILRNSEEESVLAQILKAYISLTDTSKINDIAFDVMEQFLNTNINSHRYSNDIIHLVINLLISLIVSGSRATTQQMLSFSVSHITMSPEIQESIRSMAKDFKDARQFTQHLLLSDKNWINEDSTVGLITRVLQVHSESSEINEFYIETIKASAQSKVLSSSRVISLLIQNVKKTKGSQDKLLSTIIGACLHEKQRNQQFDLHTLTQNLFSQILGNSVQNTAEFLIKLALESKNDVKKVFAILSLTQITKQRAISPHIMIVLIMSLLQVNSKIVREHTLNLIQAYTDIKEDSRELAVFTDTVKPKSTKKTTDRQDFTPIKVKPIQKFFKSLLSMRNEIINDRSQFSNALNGSAQVAIVDSSVRSILDLPSLKIKTLFVRALSALNKFSIIFAMSLQEQLKREYFQLKNLNDSQQFEYLSAIGHLISKMCLARHNDAQEEFIQTLIFPYLAFVFNYSSQQNQIPFELEEQLVEIFKNNLTNKSVIRVLRSEHKSTILKYFIQSQLYLYSKINRQSIRDTLIQQLTATGETQSELGFVQILSDKEFLPILIDAKDRIIKSNQTDSKATKTLEIILETLSQISVQNEVNLLPAILDVIMALSKHTQTQNDAFYLIELSVQQSIQIISNSQKVKSNTANTILLIKDILESQFTILTQHIEIVLSSQTGDASDPFKQFLMEVDERSSQILPEDTDKLSSIFQVISSVFNLLLSFEITTTSTSSESQNYLGECSSLLQNTISDERSHKSAGTLLLNQVFRFYHQQVVRATKASTIKGLDIKQMLASFIDSTLKMQEINLNLDEMHHYLRQVVIESQNTAFMTQVLLCHGKSSVSVKDNLELDSTEIKLGLRLLLDSKDILQLIEELLFYVTCIRLSDQSDQFIKQRLNLMFPAETVTYRSDISFWTQQKYISTDKDARRLKYLAVYLINDWISKNTLVQKQMAFISQEHQSNSQQMFYQIYLSSSVFNEAVTHSLQTKDYNGDKKVKKSLKRLHSRIQEFQRNLNNLLSYGIQVSIVNRVLTEFKDQKQTINMRTITLQLLLNKTPQFAQTLSKVQEKEMVIIFAPLINNAISILQSSLAQLSTKSNNEKQNFIMALLSLLQRTTSSLWQQDVKNKILCIVLGFKEHLDSFSLMLHSQLILTAMTIFEVHHLDILEHLQEYFEILMSSYSRISVVQQDFFSESFAKTLLKATMSVCTFFSKFLTATQYEAIIKNTLTITDKSLSEEVKQILDVICKESTKHVGFKLIFQAMINSYDEIIVESISEDSQNSATISVIIIRFFNDLFKQVIQRIKKEFVVQNHKKIYDFFKNAFTLTYTFSKHNNGLDMSNVRDVEDAIAQSFEQFAIKMNEEQLRPLIVKQTKWAFKSKGQELQEFPFNQHKVIMFIRTMNTLLKGLKEFFVPVISLYFDQVITCLTLLGQQQNEASLKRKRTAIEFNQDDDQNHNLYELLELLVDNLKLNFQFDTLSFIQNDSFEKISEPLAALVTLTQLGNKYSLFVENTLKPTVFDLVERINNDDMWKKINYDILMHTRNASAQVRLGAFKIIETLFQRVGERYLILLNDTLPFISEGMEDENPDVEATAKSIVARIEQMTGDSIHEYLK